MTRTRSRAKGESGRRRSKPPADEPAPPWGKTPATDAGVLRSVLDGMAEAVVVADAAGRLVYFNPAAERLHGIGLTGEPPEGWGRRYGIFLPDGVTPCPAGRVPLARTIRGERPDAVELVVRRPDGTGSAVEVTGRPITRALDGAVLGGVVVFSDITRRKAAERRLRETEAQLRRTLDGLLEGCMIIGYDWTYRYVNDALAAQGHKTRREMVGRRMQDVYPGIEQTAVFAEYRRCMEERVPRRFESEYVFADGTKGWYEQSAEPVAEGIFVLALEITARKRVEEQLKTSSSYARGLIEASLDPLVTISAEGKITDVNAASEAATGVPRAELIGSDFSDYFTEPERARAGYQAVFAQGQVRDYPLTIRHRSGATTDVLYNATVYRDPHGEVAGVFAAARDVSERQRLEQALHAERQRFEHVLEGLPVFTLLMTPDFHVRYTNRRFREIFGEPAGRRCYEFIFGLAKPCAHCESFVCLQTHAPHQWEWTSAAGRSYHIYDQPFTDVDGTELVLEMGIDVTDRKRAEEQLRATSEYARGLIEASLDPLVTISTDGKITDVNAATEAVTGVVRAELIGSDFSDYFTEPERARAGYQEVFAQGLVRDYPLTIRHRSGTTTDVLYNATVYRDAGGAVAGVFAAARDITERERSEREIRRLNRLYDVLSRINAMLVRVRRPQELFEEACRIAVESGSFEMAWVGVADEKTHFIRPVASHGNVGSYLDTIRISVDDVPQGRGPTGRALREGRGFVCRDIEHDPLMRPWCDAALAMGYRASAAFPLRTGEAVTGVFTVYSRDAGLFAPEEVRLLEQMASDISYALVGLERERQRRRAEEQLRQAQKMEAVGRLAGGIAHDFNNLLTVIVANLGLIETAPSHQARELEIGEIEAAVQRGRTMVRQLLDFARQGAVELVPCDLGALASDVARMLQRVLPENIELECSAAPRVGVATADAGAMEQVLMNLVTNARDAMPDGGRLRISVDVVRVGAEEAGQAGVEPGAFVRTTVRDNGVGMDEETLRHLFDPFFTTKPVGKGTGLGLPMVYGLVRQHGGFVRVASERGRGTAVEVLVPVSLSPAVARAPAAPGPAAALPRGSETILVVEDQGELRRAAIRILERYGYRTIEAANGEEALTRLASGADVALVFTDLVMPKLGGKALYDQVRATSGQVRFLFASGYTSQDTAERMGLDPRLPFLPKPWTLADLVRRVREVLDAPPHADPQ